LSCSTGVVLAKVTARRRRTAEESREIILTVAARRLRQHGLDGLNITGVAEEAGISHATLLHHFGSSGGMREALAEKMTAQLISDLVEALNANVPLNELVANVFDALAAGGHAKLIAWRTVEGGDDEQTLDVLGDLFERLLNSSRQALHTDDQQELRQIIYLVTVAAIGHGLAGDVLSRLLKMSDEEVEQFPQWMRQRLT